MPVETPTRKIASGIPGSGKTNGTSTPKPPRSNRRQAITELLAIPQIPLGMMAAAQTARNPGQISPFSLDMYTLAEHTDSLAEAVDGIADAYPVLGATLDRLGATTPFMALIGVGMVVAFQIAENHGKLPETMNSIPGVVDREEYAKRIIAEQKAKNDGRTDPTA